MKNSQFDTVFKLHTLGYSMIPAGTNKAPIAQWKQYQDKPPDETQLTTWNDELNPSLWGIVTSANIAVIDADTVEEHAKLSKELGDLPPKKEFSYNLPFLMQCFKPRHQA